jgi:hypothetical protein
LNVSLKNTKMINKNIIIAVCVRDCEPYLNKLFINIEKIQSIFFKTQVVFVESDSVDFTCEIITQYSIRNENVKIYNLGNLAEKINSRTDRIAYCRNIYLDFAEDQKNKFDYLLVLDGDAISTEVFSSESICSNFEKTDWDMVTANQPNGYYDIWALRHDKLMPFDCWAEFSKYGTREAFEFYITSRFIRISPEEDWLSVASAFGGAGFIKIDSIKGSRHIGHSGNGEPICEWVPFCKSLKEGCAKIFVNPKFINSTAVSEHIKANLGVLW